MNFLYTTARKSITSLLIFSLAFSPILQASEPQNRITSELDDITTSSVGRQPFHPIFTLQTETIPSPPPLPQRALTPLEDSTILPPRNARQLAAYAGLTPCHRTSGTSLKGKSRLSKMGSSALRKALYFPAIVAKSHNPLLHAFALKLEKKGKHTMVIIAAIMRKLLHICFGLLKHKIAFNAELITLNP